MSVRIIVDDCLRTLRAMPSESVHLWVTSPPYWGLRDYGLPASVWGGDPKCEHVFGERVRKTGGAGLQGKNSQRAGRGNIHDQEKIRNGGEFCQSCGAWRGCLGLEPDFRMFIAHTVEVFEEARRVLRSDGLCYVNMGDCYTSHGFTRQGKPRSVPQMPNDWAGTEIGQRIGRQYHAVARVQDFGNLKSKDRVLMPHRLAIALQDAGWWVRDEIVWEKPNPMPSSVEDRTTPAHEMVFMLSKSARYFYDGEAIREGLAASSIARLSIENQIGGPRADAYEADGMNARSGSRRPNQIVAGLARRSGNKVRTKADERGVPEGSRSNVGGSIPWEGHTRNKRSVWSIPPEPFAGEFCRYCRTYFEGDDLAALICEVLEKPDGTKIRVRWCACGWCDGWLSHFATFPPALVEPMIKAGSSEHGCCSSCGKPWVRQTQPSERYAEILGEGFHDHENDDRGNMATRGDRTKQKIRDAGMLSRERETTGWAPGCKCTGPGVEVVPCVVGDPFGGAGTVGLVANRLKRSAVLLELNPDYAEMAAQRLRKDGGFFCQVVLEDGALTREAAE